MPSPKSHAQGRESWEANEWMVAAERSREVCQPKARSEKVTAARMARQMPLLKAMPLLLAMLKESQRMGVL